MKVTPTPSRRFAEYIRLMKCDHWESVGEQGDDKGILRHRTSGQTVAYNRHDGGNDWNGARNFAADVQRICGCKIIQPRGRKRSRKNVTAPDAATEAARAKHIREHGDRLAREAAQRRSLAREAEIADLMRPGWGR